jgi:hypothetical protein
MAFTVPNRPDTGIEADQAEPDKGDFQTLGYQKSGVLSGGVVTRSGENSLLVTAVSGYLNGEYFDLSSDIPLNISAPSASGLAKFALVLIQNVSGTFSATALEGTTGNNGESATNARYPDFDTSTKMLIASVYYASGDTDIDSTGIVDKRVMVFPQANPQGVTTTPPDNVGALGEIRVHTSQSLAEGQSNIWVKTKSAGDNRWTNLAEWSSLVAEAGSNGNAATITVGSVTAGVAGSTPEVSNVRGTSSAALLDFIIPVGEDGTDGQPGSTTSWKLQANSGDLATIVADSTVNFVGDGDTTVSRSANTITITSTPTTSSYSFKVTEGSFSPQSTVNSGDVLLIYGGDGISVTRTGTYFTIDSTGSYLPLSAGVNNPLSGLLHGQGIVPTTHNTFNVGSSTLRYRTGYFSGVLYCNSVTEASDLALKEDISTSPGLDLITSLKPLSYRFKDSPDKRHWGFGAQDVASVCDTDAGIVTDEGGMGLAYSEFTAPIVKAIQELTERLEAIENG